MMKNLKLKGFAIAKTKAGSQRISLNDTVFGFENMEHMDDPNFVSERIRHRIIYLLDGHNIADVTELNISLVAELGKVSWSAGDKKEGLDKFLEELPANLTPKRTKKWIFFHNHHLTKKTLLCIHRTTSLFFTKGE